MSAPKRSERRRLWRMGNRARPDAPVGVDGSVRRTLRESWGESGRRRPLFTALQNHLLATRGRAGHQTTLEVSLGFNRAQRRALHSRAGSRSLTTRGSRRANVVLTLPGGNVRWRNPPRRWERPTSTPAQSFRFGPRWNKFAIRMEAFRRLQARVDAYKKRNVWWRRLARLLRLLFWVAPVVLSRRAIARPLAGLKKCVRGAR